MAAATEQIVVVDARYCSPQPLELVLREHRGITQNQRDNFTITGACVLPPPGGRGACRQGQGVLALLLGLSSHGNAAVLIAPPASPSPQPLPPKRIAPHAPHAPPLHRTRAACPPSADTQGRPFFMQDAKMYSMGEWAGAGGGRGKLTMG